MDRVTYQNFRPYTQFQLCKGNYLTQKQSIIIFNIIPGINVVNRQVKELKKALGSIQSLFVTKMPCKHTTSNKITSDLF